MDNKQTLFLPDFSWDSKQISNNELNSSSDFYNKIIFKWSESQLLVKAFKKEN